MTFVSSYETLHNLLYWHYRHTMSDSENEDQFFNPYAYLIYPDEYDQDKLSNEQAEVLEQLQRNEQASSTRSIPNVQAANLRWKEACKLSNDSDWKEEDAEARPRTVQWNENVQLIPPSPAEQAWQEKMERFSRYIFYPEEEEEYRRYRFPEQYRIFDEQQQMIALGVEEPEDDDEAPLLPEIPQEAQPQPGFCVRLWSRVSRCWNRLCYTRRGYSQFE